MDNRPVLFIDSGIGGLPYCMDFLKENPQEAVCYTADKKNFPYGPRGKEELSSILITLTEKLLKTVNPKIIVLACNTATISAIASMRHNFPQVPFVGTVPALKPAAVSSGNAKIGVLGTERTIEEIRGLHLVDDTCEIFGVAAPELVEFVELRFNKANQNEKNEIVKKYIEKFRAEDVKTIVLGCTHFLFLLEEFRREAVPNIKIFDSLDGITKRIEFLLDENDGALRCEKKFKPAHELLLNGTDTEDSFWQNFAQTNGFNFALLDEKL
jgi:glutamate racemase